MFKSIGVSNFQIHHLENLLKKAKVRPVMNQVECHPLLSQVPLQKYLTDNDILMTSYGPLARGEVFTGKTHRIKKLRNNMVQQLHKLLFSGGEEDCNDS